MERLTQRDNDGNAYWSGKNGKSYSDIKGNIYGVGSTKLAEYEDAEENGLLIHLPCRVGDTVYVVDTVRNFVDECTVYRISCRSTMPKSFGIDIECAGKLWHCVRSELIGICVFMNKEAAEQALAKMEGV